MGNVLLAGFIPQQSQQNHTAVDISIQLATATPRDAYLVTCVYS